MNGSESSETIYNARLSPSREIYRIALGRIQGGRGLQNAEVILWTTLAIYLGLITCNFLTRDIHWWVFQSCYWTVIAITPFVVGSWVYRVHFVPGTDETLRSVPLFPSQIISPRIWAVVLTYLRYFSPIILLLVISHELAFAYLGGSTWQRLSWWASTWLTQFPYDHPSGLAILKWEGSQCGTLITQSVVFLKNLERGVIITLAVLQSIGWISLPIMWGFYWRTKLSQPSAYWFAYFSYLLMPAALAALNYGWSSSGFRLRVPLYNIGLTPHGLLKWPWVLVVGLGGVVLSVILYNMTLRAWGRGKP